MESISSSPTTSQLIAGGNPTFTFGNQGASPSTSQNRTFQAPGRPKLLFLATLNFPYLNKLMNDPVKHNSMWPSIPTKLPSYIPKFKGKTREYPGAYVTTCHLWCSSNSQNDDTVRLRMFQRTLISILAKWHIKFPFAAFDHFWDLAEVFLNHFQLPIWYDADTDLLSNFSKDKATHISDHIQEW